MVWIVDVAGIAEDLAIYPLVHFGSGDKSGIGMPVLRANEVNRWVWPALVIDRHALLHLSPMGCNYEISVIAITVNIKKAPQCEAFLNDDYNEDNIIQL